MAAFAPPEIRGSAFGLLATVQAIGNVAASVLAGLLYTVASPTVAFVYLGWDADRTRDALVGGSNVSGGLARPATDPAPPPLVQSFGD